MCELLGSIRLKFNKPGVRATQPFKSWGKKEKFTNFNVCLKTKLHNHQLVHFSLILWTYLTQRQKKNQFSSFFTHTGQHQNILLHILLTLACTNNLAEAHSIYSQYHRKCNSVLLSIDYRYIHINMHSISGRISSRKKKKKNLRWNHHMICQYVTVLICLWKLWHTELSAARTHAARSHATTNSWTLRGGWRNSYFKGFRFKMVDR